MPYSRVRRWGRYPVQVLGRKGPKSALVLCLGWVGKGRREAFTVEMGSAHTLSGQLCL